MSEAPWARRYAIRSRRSSVASITGYIPHWATAVLEPNSCGNHVTGGPRSTAAPPESESVTWEVPSLRLTCHGREPGCVANWARLSRTCWYCNAGRVAPWLIVRWRRRPTVHPLIQAKPMTKKTRAGRMGVLEGCEWTVYACYIDKECGGREECSDFDVAAARVF